MVAESGTLEVLNPVSQVATEGIQPRRADREPFAGADSLDAWENFNRDYLDRGWGDGFPLVPPTPERIEAFLRAVRRLELDPLDVIGQPFPPGNGIATVEKLAINCAMAGCEPEHLPLIIGATEAMTESPDAFAVRDLLESPAPYFPMLFLNGPVIEKLGINAGMCSLGPGKPSRINSVLGRALRLIVMNIGHCYPQEADLDTIGSPSKYSYCLAENEEMNPWDEPFHVERGFKKNDSVVTIFNVNSIAHFGGYTGEADKLLLSLGRAMRHDGPAAPEAGWHYLVMLCPDHARSLAGGGETKKSIRDFILERAPSMTAEQIHFTVVGGPSSGSELFLCKPSISRAINI